MTMDMTDSTEKSKHKSHRGQCDKYDYHSWVNRHDNVSMHSVI